MSIDKKVLTFLKDNPGATPREIADALGVPLSVVRISLIRLRESGLVIKSPRGGYLVRVARLSESESTGEEQVIEKKDEHKVSPEVDLKDLRNIVEPLIAEIRKELSELREKINKLELELMSIKKTITTTASKPMTEEKEKTTTRRDRLIEELSRRPILTIEEARRLALNSLDTYFAQGIIIPVAQYVVSKDFYEEFKKKFPIKVTELKKLSDDEKKLLDAMIREGLVYLYGGREYRVIE